MLTIITPCCRQYNLPELEKSIKFDMISNWIIVYDTTKGRTYEHMYGHNSKVTEVDCDNSGIVGNAQRNLGIDITKTEMIYFLDDDNIVHPNLWTLLPTFVPGKFYTFDQLRDHKRGKILKGNRPAANYIDTAQFVVDRRLVGDLRWEVDKYAADGYFIQSLYERFSHLHTYIPLVACYYNFLTK